MRAILVDAYDRGVTSRPTPPEDVAAAIAYLTPIAESATVGRYGEMLRVALAALAAVPADGETECVAADAERAWREGYYTGKRDYAGSVMGGMSISTPNPYSLPIPESEGGDRG